MATAQAKDNTKKRPPAFTHLPQQRGNYTSISCIVSSSDSDIAKKLKQAWVEKQKIKSQWKAAQRKEGSLTSRRAPPNPVPSSGINDGHQGGEGSASGADFDDGSSGKPNVHVQPGPTRLAVSNDPISARNDSDLRELRRQAYSPSSLHTLKADPLGRRCGTEDRGRGRDGAVPSSGHPEPSNHTIRGHDRRKGRRGQPDMRLRMNVMLEKIKRDIA
jgi:hypothetical protein